ncbi:ankyrin repeat domain-containing protein [Candidatus Dependentiae bacterium]|nr:ankyrin repeat domain-containing protein [Candidatus Dependentiae bacterium]
MNKFYFLLCNMAIISTSQAVINLSPSSSYIELAHKGNALAEAVKEGDYKKVMLLLNYLYDINSADESGYTPLHWAVGTQDESITRLLLEHGALITPSMSGLTPLHLAAFKKDIVLLKMLLHYPLSLDYKDASGCTALYYAACTDDQATVALLLDAGACCHCISAELLETVSSNTIKSSIKLYRALLEASYCNVKEVNLLLLKGAQLTPLIVANLKNLAQVFDVVEKKDCLTLKSLLGSGVSINAKDITGDTLLHKAMKTQDTSLVKLLLDNDADMTLKDAQGKTPIYLASTAELLRLFIYTNK